MTNQLSLSKSIFCQQILHDSGDGILKDSKRWFSDLCKQETFHLLAQLPYQDSNASRCLEGGPAVQLQSPFLMLDTDVACRPT